MENSIVKTKCKCPKCKSDDLIFMEVWEGHTITWECISGKFDREDGALEPGDPYRVDGKCKKCQHVWRIRKALQIDDIIK